MSLLEATLAEVLADAIAASGAWMSRAAHARRGRPSERDRAIAQWFDAFELAEGLAEVPALPGEINEEDVAAWLTNHETQAVLQELIVVRLTDAPRIDLDRVQQNLRYACLDTFPELDKSTACNLSDAIFGAADHEVIEIMGRLESRNATLLDKVREGAFAGRTVAL
jgi:hypothetical protein